MTLSQEKIPVGMRRYLIDIHPKRMTHFFTDVLIIGGGLAGLRAANEIAPHVSTLVVTKDKLAESNSQYAQGGIATVWDPEDRFEDHVQDTLTAGGALCDRDIVEMVVHEAPQRVEELIRWGTRFDSHNGELLLGREGGHSHQRILHALGDATGKEIMRAVIERTRGLSNVTIWERTFTIDLLTHEGVCCGAVVAVDGQSPTLVWAKQTILCSGGCGQVYRESTNPRVATGDGHAIAYRAGAEVRDMEFMQFHPTVLYLAGSARTLITEAIRGEGAYLVDSNGYRFMSDYDARLELAPRDIVSQAIVSQMEKTQHPCVYLTMQHLDPIYVRQRFPGIAKTCDDFGIDIAKDRIPVRPGAHYMIGGVTVDASGRTSIPGLWAAGEVTSSGLHGANRLASNSLLEGLVFGAKTGEGASLVAESMPHTFQVLPISYQVTDSPLDPLDLTDIRNSLQSLMWRSVGVRRTGPKLEEAWQTIHSYGRYVLSRQFHDVSGWELQNLLLVSGLITRAATIRSESRGVHLRTDFPTVNDEQWMKHINFQAT
jgi:L-aspartate oxidase